MLKRYIPILLTVFFLLPCNPGFAGTCPPNFVKAMQQEGLDEMSIASICDRLARLAGDEKPVITVEKIEKDITGKMVPGWIFQASEWREIDILDSKYTNNKAKIEINVDTIRNKSGTLRLRYRWVDNRWKLVKLFNVDFD